MWERAKQIAKDMLDGKIWLAEVGHATHYHAYWVHPSWVHEMKKMYKLGVHTFYRPRAWGDGATSRSGAHAPAAPRPPRPAPRAKSRSRGKSHGASQGPEAAAKVPQAAAPPPAATGKSVTTAKL